MLAYNYLAASECRFEFRWEYQYRENKIEWKCVLLCFYSPGSFLV